MISVNSQYNRICRNNSSTADFYTVESLEFYHYLTVVRVYAVKRYLYVELSVQSKVLVKRPQHLGLSKLSYSETCNERSKVISTLVEVESKSAAHRNTAEYLVNQTFSFVVDGEQ